jgi:hypothetical protein
VTGVHAGRVEAIVVAGQDDDGSLKPAQLCPRERDSVVRHGVVIEEIPGDQEEIHVVAQRTVDDALENLPLARLMRGIPVAVAAEMQVRRVQDAERPFRTSTR